VSEKKQVKVRLDADEAREFKQLADRHFGSNVEAAREAFEMLKRAHGMTDAESIKDDIQEIDREMQRVRREANEELAQLHEEREELVETLEWRQEQEDLVEMTIEEIADGLASNPNQNIHAYTEQVEFLISHNDGPIDLEGVVKRVEECAQDNGERLGVKQLYPRQWDEAAGSAAATDGAGDASSESVEYDGFEYPDEDGDSV